MRETCRRTEIERDRAWEMEGERGRLKEPENDGDGRKKGARQRGSNLNDMSQEKDNYKLQI